jgi:hypothetical protein
MFRLALLYYWCAECGFTGVAGIGSLLATMSWVWIVYCVEDIE